MRICMDAGMANIGEAWTLHAAAIVRLEADIAIVCAQNDAVGQCIF